MRNVGLAALVLLALTEPSLGQTDIRALEGEWKVTRLVSPLDYPNRDPKSTVGQTFVVKNGRASDCPNARWESVFTLPDQAGSDRRLAAQKIVSQGQGVYEYSWWCGNVSPITFVVVPGPTARNYLRTSDGVYEVVATSASPDAKGGRPPSQAQSPPTRSPEPSLSAPGFIKDHGTLIIVSAILLVVVLLAGMVVGVVRRGRAQAHGVQSGSRGPVSKTDQPSVEAATAGAGTAISRSGFADRLLGPAHRRGAIWKFATIAAGVLLILVAAVVLFDRKSPTETARQMLVCVRYLEVLGQKAYGISGSSQDHQTNVAQVRGYAAMFRRYIADEHVDANSIQDGGPQGAALAEKDFDEVLRNRDANGRPTLTNNIKTFVAGCQSTYASAGFTEADWTNCMSSAAAGCTRKAASPLPANPSASAGGPLDQGEAMRVCGCMGRAEAASDFTYSRRAEAALRSSGQLSGPWASVCEGQRDKARLDAVRSGSASIQWQNGYGPSCEDLLR